MCYAPIKIRNNSLTYRSGIDKLYYTVPCGKCRECQQKKRDDWYIRAYYEWLYYNEIGGMTIFITLTYNEWSKPFVSFADVDLQVLDEYVGHLYNMVINPSESKFVPNHVHTVDYYEDRFNEKFPISHYDFINDFGECVDRFNKKHIQDFFKSLRQYFHTHSLWTYDQQSVNAIKYFAVCEYGEQKHRQHVHCLVYLPFKMDVLKFKDIAEHCWSDRISSNRLPDFAKTELVEYKKKLKAGKVGFEYTFSTPGTRWFDWTIRYDAKLKRINTFHLKGFCQYSKENPPVIQSGAGIEYVMKYLYKADRYVSEDRFLKLKTWLQFFPSMTTLGDNKRLINAVTALNDIFPFHLNSQGLGQSLYDELNSKSPDELINFLKNPKPICMTDSSRFFAVPQYILNRLLYDGVNVPLSDNTVRMLTPVGYKSVCQLFDTKIYSLARSFAENVNVALGFMNETDKLHYFNQTGKHIDKVVKLVPDFRALAHYHLCWQDVAPKLKDDDKLLWSSYDFMRESRTLYFSQKAPSFEFGKSLNKFDYLAMVRLSSNCYNYYPAFKHFDEVLNAINYIRECIGMRDARHEFDDENKTSRYRECLKMFKYD